MFKIVFASQTGSGNNCIVDSCLSLYIYIYISKGLRHSADPLEFRIGGQWGAAQVTGLGWSGVEWKGVFSIEMVWIGVE